MYHVHTHMTNLHLQHYMSQHWDTTKPGLWTLDWTMDWTMDWTGLIKNSCIQTANSTKATTSCLHLCLKLLPSLLRRVSWISVRSKVTCIFNKLQQRWLWLNPRGFWNWLWVSMTCIHCFLWRPHAFAWKAPSSHFDWALVRRLCLLEGLEEQWETKSSLRWSIENRRNSLLSSRLAHVEAH